MNGTPLHRLAGYGKRLMCIVRLAKDWGVEQPHVFYRVIFDPAQVTASGLFHMFEGPGNDLYGIKPIEAFEVFEVLGEVESLEGGNVRVKAWQEPALEAVA